jgi:hypothetical protein
VYTHSVSSFSFFSYFFFLSLGDEPDRTKKDKETYSGSISKEKRNRKEKRTPMLGFIHKEIRETDESNSIGEGTYFLFSLCSPSWTDLKVTALAAFYEWSRIKENKKRETCHWRLASHWAQ